MYFGSQHVRAAIVLEENKNEYRKYFRNCFIWMRFNFGQHQQKKPEHASVLDSCFS